MPLKVFNYLREKGGGGRGEEGKNCKRKGGRDVGGKAVKKGRERYLYKACMCVCVGGEEKVW